MKSITLSKVWENHRDHLVAMIFASIVIVALAWVLSVLLGAFLFIALLSLSPLIVSWVFIIRQASLGRYLGAQSIYFGFRNYARSMMTGIYLAWPAVATFFVTYLVASLPVSLFVFRNVVPTEAMFNELMELTTIDQIVTWLNDLSINLNEFAIAMILLVLISLLAAVFVYSRRQFSLVASMDAVKAPLPVVEMVVKTYAHKYQWQLFAMNTIAWLPLSALLVLFIVWQPVPIGASPDAQMILNGIIAFMVIVPLKIIHAFYLTDWYQSYIFEALKKRNDESQPLPPNS